jgi:hypothetical protein
MESPIPSTEIIALGKKLAREFAKDERVSPTLGWVCQYLAELINRIETATDIEQKKKYEKECLEIILKLWKNKAALPHRIRPLQHLEVALEVLAALKDDDPQIPVWQRTRDLENKSPYGKFVERLREDSQMIVQIIALLVIGKDILAREKEWAVFPGLLSDDEKKIIDDLDWLVSTHSASAYKSVFADLDDLEPPASPVDRYNTAIDKIISLLSTQIKSAEALTKRIK